MLKYILLLITFLSLYACSKKVEKAQSEAKKPKMHIKVKRTSYKKLNKIASKKLKDWDSYNNLAVFLKRFENTSPNEALSNALELKELIHDIKEATPEGLNTPAFRARLNTLENEILRFVDITYIPAITPKEVNSQIDKIFLVFGSLNAKINTVYNQKRFNDEIDLGSFFELDSAEVIKNNPKEIPEYVD